MGWDAVLGYDYNLVIEDFPCTFHNGIMADATVTCDLHTPESAAALANKEWGYLEVRPFVTMPAIGAFTYMQIPGIKIGSLGKIANLKFQVREDTPGMINDHVTLYFQNY